MSRSVAPPADGRTDDAAPPGGRTDDAAAPERLTRSVWSSAGIVFVGNVVARGLGFAFPLVLARAVSRDDFALVYLFITTGFFVGELVLAGFPTSLTRYLAAPAGEDRGAWFLSAMVAGLPLLGLSLTAGIVFANQAQADPWLLGLVILGLTVDAYYFSALRGLARFSLLVGYRIGANLAQIVLLVVAWALGIASVPLAVAIYALTYLVPILVIEGGPGPVRSIVGAASRPRRDLMGPLTRFAIPALVSGTAYAAILGLDVYWVRLLAPDHLADYSAARALAMPMSLVPFAIGVVLLPRVAATGPAGKWRLLRQSMLATVAAAAIAVVGYVVFAPLVVGIVYPDAFAGAAETLPPLALAMGAVGVYSVLSQWWMGRGDPRRPAAALVTGAIVAGVAHVVLDTRYGGLGAAVAMLVGASTSIAILGVLTLRLPDQPRRRDRPRVRR